MNRILSERQWRPVSLRSSLAEYMANPGGTVVVNVYAEGEPSVQLGEGRPLSDEDMEWCTSYGDSVITATHVVRCMEHLNKVSHAYSGETLTHLRKVFLTGYKPRGKEWRKCEPVLLNCWDSDSGRYDQSKLTDQLRRGSTMHTFRLEFEVVERQAWLECRVN